jgi:hypothetical protein
VRLHDDGARMYHYITAAAVDEVISAADDDDDETITSFALRSAHSIVLFEPKRALAQRLTIC